MLLFTKSKSVRRTSPKLKRALELPANVIVIFIIAVVVLLGVLMFFFNNYIKLSPSIIGLSKNTSEELREVLPCGKLSESDIEQICDKECSKISGYSYAGEYKVNNIIGIIRCKCKNNSDIKYVEVRCQ